MIPFKITVWCIVCGRNLLNYYTMKKYLSLLASFCVAIGFIGCGGSSDEPITPPEPPTPEVIDVVEPTNPASQDGFERVELSWQQDCSADIKKTTIYWNGRKNSQTVNFSAASTSGKQTEGLELNIAEGEYEFELVNIDSKGNKSDAVKVAARAYGEAYCAELDTREISAIYYEDDTAFITWEEALDDEIRTEYSYTDSESEQTVTAEVNALNEHIKVLPNETISVRTVYKPAGCMDDLYSPVKEFVVPEPEPVVVPVVRDASALDGECRVEISWMHDPAEDVAQTLISWNDGEDTHLVTYGTSDEQEAYEIREMIEVSEGSYTFELKNIDAEGNESETVAIEARAYGDEYCSQLPTREITSMVYEEDYAVVEWAEADQAAIRTEYRYIDAVSGEEKYGIVTETSHNISAAPLSVVKVQSVYQPERCMDELWSPVKEYTVPEPEVIDVAEPTDLVAMDGLGRVQISWKQDTSADVSRTLLSWGDESLPHNVELLPDSESGEYSKELTLDEGEYTFRLQNFDSKGNASDVVVIEARSYGEQYCATLPTRELVAITAEGSGASAYYNLSWGKACEGELRTKYSFTSSQTGDLTIKTAQPTSSKSTYVRAVAGSKIKVQSIFKPENCLDELESVGVEYDTPAPPAGPELVDVKIMQFNVCVGDWLTSFNGYIWSQRCKQIAALIKEQEPDVICFQELSPAGFYNDIMKAINNTYSNSVGDVYSGVYAERGNPSNEGIGLAYKTTRFDKVNGGMFWLNDHPDSAGLYSAGGLSSNYNRICVWARLRDKSTKGEFVLASTHIDNANNDAHAATDYAVMNGQVQIAINNVQARSKGEDDELPIVIAGDMNANPDKSPIKRFSNAQNKYTDAYTVAQSITTQSTSIPRSTMVDVVSGGLQQNYACYDYIFMKRYSKVMSYSINSPKFGGVTLSDHNSVTAVVQLECRVME
ncbi:MAG: hypothetical protein E7133_02485 [Rikenellaceae bacterium]|nr:hypothetical protein [Rikenellaceae bacterium]